MRTWTSGRDGPPAQDTSTPPPTAGRACPPPSPALLITITAPVRKGEAPKGTGRARGDNTVPRCPQLLRQHGASLGYLHYNLVLWRPVATQASLSPCRCHWQGKKKGTWY